ncbi:MAG: ATP-binding protein [Hyphomonadaceae bacterium]
MQHFVNHAAIERTAGEVFTGPRARYYVYGLVALACAAAAGLALATIWLGLILLIDATRIAAFGQAAAAPGAQPPAAALALDLAAHAGLAAAPAIAWFGGGELGGAVACAMLAALTVDCALNARRGRRYALATAAPYAAVGLAMLIEASSGGALPAAAACALALGYAFAAALHRNARAAHARDQDGEWVRQLNMSYGDGASAAWELDFERRTLAGADALAALLGRPASYADIAEGACFAPEADKALVMGAFAPAHGAARRVALEHDVLRPDGSRLRVRHQGFVRTTPDGVPRRLTCITQIPACAGAQITPEHLDAALAAQVQTLRTLENELAICFPQGAAPGGRPLTQLAENAAAIERGVDELAHARHSADSANLAKSQFLANMSHELRTPLNAIIGYAEMLHEDAEDSGDDDDARDLQRILTAAKHLLALLNEVLDLSKIEAGRMEASAAAFNPNELIEELAETLRPSAAQNGNTLTFTGTCTDAYTDAMKLRQCALNLLSNAVKFTKQGAIEVSLNRRRYNGVDQIFVTVSDTGIGMSKAHMSRLFQPFVQADPSITQQFGGTGLGLTITRRLAQLLGGDVTVKSILGEGSTFTLHVPANFSDASAALGAAAQIDDVQGADSAPLVIVIEDEPDARELAARALTRAGFAVQGVGGGEAGLALARAKSPALVLLDIFLPDRSGWRVLQSLKQDPKTSDIPVVVLSVNEDRAHALALGAAEHIVKPADRDKLAATVMRFARKRAAPDADAPATTVATKAAS